VDAGGMLRARSDAVAITSVRGHLPTLGTERQERRGPGETACGNVPADLTGLHVRRCVRRRFPITPARRRSGPSDARRIAAPTTEPLRQDTTPSTGCTVGTINDTPMLAAPTFARVRTRHSPVVER
jgi:hypothetical protein